MSEEKKYILDIAETRRKQVAIYAKSRREACATAEDMMQNHRDLLELAAKPADGFNCKITEWHIKEEE